jgi:long-chain acyl-CoA synthetase
VVCFDDLVGPKEGYIALPAEALPEADIGLDDPATLLYTSGTSGRPKGALGTHSNLLSNIVSRRFAPAFAALRRGEPAPPPNGRPATLLAPVPLFHVTGCHSYLASSLATGSTLVLMYRWDPGRALELIERERVTNLGGVPAMILQVLESPEVGRRDTSSLIAVGYGGAPSGASLVHRIKAALPRVHTSNGYGMTEASSLVTQISAEDHLARPESVGRAMPVCDLRIVGERDQDVGRGEVGELWVRGPNVVSGYWRDPEATRATFGGGWLRTGDLARMDEERFVYLVDRIKDMVIRGGENVYCAEVEDALLSHPDVADCAVLGLPDAILGETVAAVVRVASHRALSSEALRAHVAARLAPFKVPQAIEVSSEPLPRNPAGKVQKQELRQRLLDRRGPPKT